MTVEELKLEAAKLDVAERLELATWLTQDPEVHEASHERLRAELQEGLAAADRSELIDAEEVFARLREKYSTLS